MSLTENTTAALTRTGLNRISQALSIFDASLRLAVCNRRYQEMFTFPEAYVTPGVSFEDTIRYMVCRGEYGHFDDTEEAVAARVSAARAFLPHYMERRRPNGRWVSVEGSPLAQGGWVTIYTDITEVKLQEELLRARSEELSGEVLAHAQRLALANRELAAANAMLDEARRDLIEIEARTRMTTEMMPAHIAHVGRDLRYTYSNRRLNIVAPTRSPDIIGLTGHEALGAQTFAHIAPALRRALAGQATVLEFTEEESGRRIRGAFTPDRQGEGPVNGVYILSTDVTAEAQAREVLMQTRKRELAAQLTSGLAHDFSNLLTIILGLQSRLSRADLPPGAGDLVHATLNAGRRGGVLLDRIASISGRRELQIVPVRIADFVSELRPLIGAALPDRISAELEIAPFAHPLMFDPGMLQDALLNLVLNARDAMKPQGGRMVLSIRPVRDIWLEVTVSDEGPGFTPEALERGLEPFFTTKGGEGSGLGLAMVYDRVKLAGGNLRLANQASGGASVTLRLPLRPAEDRAAEPGMVLLVEDNTEIRESVRAMLVSLGHSVVESDSAEEALALMRLPCLTLVLSDIHLGGAMTGLDLAARFEADPDSPPVVLMTSSPPGDPRREAASARGPLLIKPFDALSLAGFLATLPILSGGRR
ncbi:hybrid sensor histidine kinase/response regulator [Falsigemmobacter faecalis]|uniref:histidine kinase n=1 Tax=Falsigemmobacter faecalis TaxID=2488730 RepID=A0A3P3DW44_9RHOB|nr:PAS-domain containing protein [Falsigemmobacter faecalis]RRH77966.1 response regulator [Falsigemmobacter faecalis]